MAEHRTERLLLRHWLPQDRDPFAVMNADREVMRHFPAPLTREQCDAFLDRIAGELDSRGWGLWAVEERASGTFLGFVGLAAPRFEAHFTPTVEVGWRLRRSAWGKGYATEAGREALRVGFDDLGLAEIVSLTATSNTRSMAVMRRLGMTRDPADDFPHPSLPEGHPLRPHVLFRLPRL